ncbi:MAG: hypothetical protein EXS63_05685 [Candidatus Omnitrophica bacterium]|nr:hypothetical protein [Candidatus Omnitrophota bacterium]
MYRRAEYELMNFLFWVSLVCILGAMIFVGIYYFRPSDGLYRSLALIFMVLGLFFQLQIFMYKVTIMERRLLHLVGFGEQHFVIAEKRDTLQLVVFFILLWITLIGVICAFLSQPA